jgi:hypothetical protein
LKQKKNGDGEEKRTDSIPSRVKYFDTMVKTSGLKVFATSSARLQKLRSIGESSMADKFALKLA